MSEEKEKAAFICVNGRFRGRFRDVHWIIGLQSVSPMIMMTNAT